MAGSRREVRVFRTSAVAALMVVSLASALVAQDKKKEWKDRSEYDLYEAITKTQDANQWLSILDKWKSQYEPSDYADVRRQMYLTTYRALNKPAEAFRAAIEVLKDNPDNLVALSAITGYVYALVPLNAQPTADQTLELDTAEKAAGTILGNLDTIYSKENRPPEMTDDQAAKAKPELKAFAQKTVGYIALVRKEDEKAQTELSKALEMDPTQAQVSYWLGSAVVAQNKTKPELQPAALYDFARAAAYDGPGSLPAPDRKQVMDYLNKVFVQYHGSSDGLDKLVASAKGSAFPPAGFAIRSKSEIDKERIEAEEAAARANPMLALWKSIKKELQSDGGQAYFDNSMKGAALPGGVNNVARFKGKLVGMTPPNRPKELTLAMEDPSKPDVTLKFESALPGKMQTGGDIEFEGIAESFTKDPFMVTFTAEKSKIDGWTGKNPPLLKKSGGGNKSGASK
jgi:tetratricopeptide (TPR) repeat protein